MGRPLNARLPTFWELLAAYPPITVRLCARFACAGSGVRSLSNREIAISSGIPLARILQINESFTWDDITVGELHRFCIACNFDPTSACTRQRIRTYLRSCQIHPNRLSHYPRYLMSSPFWEEELYPLILRLKSQPKFSPGSKRSLSPEVRSAA